MSLWVLLIEKAPVNETLTYEVTHTNVHCLVLLQKRIIRLLCGAKRLNHWKYLFHNVHILKVPDLVELKTAILWWRHIVIYFQWMYNCLEFRIHESLYKSRHKCKFKQTNACTNLTSMCVSITGVKLCISVQKVLYRQTIQHNYLIIE